MRRSVVRYVYQRGYLPFFSVTTGTVQRVVIQFSTLHRPWYHMNASTRALAKDLVVSTPTSSSQEEEEEDDPWRRRRALSEAITLVESCHPDQREQASLLLTHLLQEGNTTATGFRVGITGAPGAGKSTFIEALGRYVLNLAPRDDETWVPLRLAVVCIDPSSSLTGGSILGDKARMTELSRHPRAPSVDWRRIPTTCCAWLAQPTIN
jgi:Methylmalonyl Co-A mutase-associated GTPase MeaB